MAVFLVRRSFRCGRASLLCLLVVWTSLTVVPGLELGELAHEGRIVIWPAGGSTRAAGVWACAADSSIPLHARASVTRATSERITGDRVSAPVSVATR